MPHTGKLSRHLQRVFVLRGFVLLVPAAVGFFGPDRVLLDAITVLAAAAFASGIHELAVAVRARGRVQPPWALAAHGALVVLFGFVTLVTPRAFTSQPGVAVAGVAGWLVVATMFALAASAYEGSHPIARAALLAWSTVNAALVVGALLDPPVAVAGLTRGGALYAMGFALLELALGAALPRVTRDIAPPPEPVPLHR